MKNNYKSSVLLPSQKDDLKATWNREMLNYPRRQLQAYRRRQKLIRTAKGAGRIAWNIFLAFSEAAKLMPGYNELPQNPPQTEE